MSRKTPWTERSIELGEKFLDGLVAGPRAGEINGVERSGLLREKRDLAIGVRSLHGWYFVENFISISKTPESVGLDESRLAIDFEMYDTLDSGLFPPQRAQPLHVRQARVETPMET